MMVIMITFHIEFLGIFASKTSYIPNELLFTLYFYCFVFVLERFSILSMKEVFRYNEELFQIQKLFQTPGRIVLYDISYNCPFNTKKPQKLCRAAFR